MFTACLGEKKVCSGEFCYYLYVQVVSLNPLFSFRVAASSNTYYCSQYFFSLVLLVWQPEPEMG